MAAGGLLATQAAAQADIVTTGNYGLANGTQVVVPIQAPINLCGNSIALIGGAFASCDGGAVAVNGGGGQEAPQDNGYRKHHDDEFAKAEGKYKAGKKHGKDALGGGSNIVSSGNYGLLNGTQVVVPIQVPINVAGNAIGVIGGAFAQATGGAVAVNESARAEGYDSRGRQTEANLISANNFGALNGTQVYAPIQVPINVCGNAIALIGGAFASCGGGAVAVNESAREEANLISTNNFGALNGTQLYAPIQIPINVCGNAIALIGGAFASCGGG
ncbi:chaplin family protein, partial [Asanoa siamensis]|uniref:chaplin family protein n=1 Tax=Asanoa siamensis TaxID=926357 RepID=UPI0019429C42